MADDNQIQMEFVIDDKSVKTQFAKIENAAEKTEPKLSKAFNKKPIVEFAAGLFIAEKAFQLFNLAASKVVNTIGKAIDLAVEAEAANIKLGAAFSTLNPAARATEQSFKDFASALQNKIAVDDDFIKSNAAVLVSLGRLSGEGLERATKASFDLAKGIGTSAEATFFLLAKAANGSTEALSRYGIKVDQTIPKSKRFEAVLAQIEKKFGGLAEADTKTFAGALKVIDLAFDDLLQSFGQVITQSPSLIAVFKLIGDTIVASTKSFDAIKSGGQDLFKPFLIGLFDVGLAINNYFVKPLELGFNLVRTGVLTVYSAIQGIIAAFVNLSSAIAQFLFKPIIDGFGFLAEKVVGLFDQDLANRLSANIAAFGQTVGGSLDVLADSTTSVFKDSFDSLAASADNTFKSKIGGSLDEFLNKLKTTADQAKAITDGIAANTGNSADKIVEYSSAIKSAADSMRAGIVQSISTIGAALFKGEGMFDNFGKGVVGIFGDLAISIGTTLLFTGQAIEKFILAIRGLLPGSGLFAAAAGIGLIIFGGALKASVGSGGASAPSASGGSAPGSTGGIGATPVQETELQPRGASVQVNISGDVFDTEETGLRIVDIISKSFDQNGVVVRGMA